jgi:hypothetical protein
MAHRRLHVVCGDVAAGSLRQAGVCEPASIVIQHDVLSCGPLAPFGSLDEWRRTREEFWKGPLFEEFPDGLLFQADELTRADEIVMCVGVGLSEQLVLPSTLRIAELAGAADVRCFTAQLMRSSVTGVEITGLGMLAPQQLRDGFGPEPVTAAGRAELRKAWDAVVSPHPAALIDFVNTGEPVFPLLRQALRWMFSKFPDVETGLNAWDTALLRHARDHGPRVVSVLAETIIAGADWLDPVGDWHLFDRLRRLANPALPHPLLTLSGDLSSLRDCRVTVTGAGQDILAGRTGFVTLNGIDDWVGGVHLDSTANRVWFRRGDSLVPDGGA